METNEIKLLWLFKMGIWVIFQPREAGRGRKYTGTCTHLCAHAIFACPDEPNKSCYSQRTTWLTSQSFQPALQTATKSMKVALFCRHTNETLYSLLLAQAFSLSGQVAALPPRGRLSCSPAGPARMQVSVLHQVKKGQCSPAATHQRCFALCPCPASA